MVLGGGVHGNLSLASHECNDNPSRLGLVGISVVRFFGLAIMESAQNYKLAFWEKCVPEKWGC